MGCTESSTSGCWSSLEPPSTGPVVFESAGWQDFVDVGHDSGVTTETVEGVGVFGILKSVIDGMGESKGGSRMSSITACILGDRGRLATVCSSCNVDWLPILTILAFEARGFKARGYEARGLPRFSFWSVSSLPDFLFVGLART